MEICNLIVEHSQAVIHCSYITSWKT